MLQIRTRQLALDEQCELALTERRLPTIGQDASTRRDQIAEGLLLRTKASRRSQVDARQCKHAIEQIIHLPQPGESLHFIVDGRFEPCDLIPATRRLSDPATIRRLDVTTLGLNSDNVQCIARGMDQGKIGECLILVSQYFAKVDKLDYAILQDEITKRNGRVNAVRTHSKLILMEMTDGSNWYTIEGSGNLRSCNSIEQFVMTNDRALLLFHRAWIEEYLITRTDSDKRRKRD
jgi:hypothetical protein